MLYFGTLNVIEQKRAAFELQVGQKTETNDDF